MMASINAQLKRAELEIAHLNQKIEKITAENSMLKAEKKATRRVSLSFSVCARSGGKGRSVRPSPSTPSYLRPTKASVSKVKLTQKSPEGACTWANEEQVIQPDWQDTTAASPSDTPDPWAPGPVQAVYDMLPEGELSAVDKVKKSSRCCDRAFYSTPAGHADIPIGEQLDLMEEARSLARVAFWTVTKAHVPDVHRRQYIHGPLAVRFGHTELLNAISHDTTSRIAASLANGSTGTDVDQALAGCIGLRNALCHQDFLSVSRVDELMGNAQTLACVISEEEIAARIRAVRDRLQRRVEECRAELVACEPLVTEPAGHHQETFCRLLKELEKVQWRRAEYVKEYGVEVVEAAEEWAQRLVKPGQEKKPQRG